MLSTSLSSLQTAGGSLFFTQTSLSTEPRIEDLEGQSISSRSISGSINQFSQGIITVIPLSTSGLTTGTGLTHSSSSSSSVPSTEGKQREQKVEEKEFKTSAASIKGFKSKDKLPWTEEDVTRLIISVKNHMQSPSFRWKAVSADLSSVKVRTERSCKQKWFEIAKHLNIKADELREKARFLSNISIDGLIIAVKPTIDVSSNEFKELKTRVVFKIYIKNPEVSTERKKNPKRKNIELEKSTSSAQPDSKVRTKVRKKYSDDQLKIMRTWAAEHNNGYFWQKCIDAHPTDFAGYTPRNLSHKWTAIENKESGNAETSSGKPWDLDEDRRLIDSVKKRRTAKHIPWGDVSKDVGARSYKACKGRWDSRGYELLYPFSFDDAHVDSAAATLSQSSVSSSRHQQELSVTSISAQQAVASIALDSSFTTSGLDLLAGAAAASTEKKQVSFDDAHVDSAAATLSQSSVSSSRHQQELSATSISAQQAVASIELDSSYTTSGLDLLAAAATSTQQTSQDRIRTLARNFCEELGL